MSETLIAPWKMQWEQERSDYEAQIRDLRAAVNEAHKVLDEAGIAPAGVCNDSSCQTKLGHRVRMLRDRVSASAGTAAGTGRKK